VFLAGGAGGASGELGEESGQLELFEKEFDLTPRIHIRLFNGHTLGQAISLIDYRGRILVNMADLMPLAGNISMSWVCGYDTQPLLSLKEKAEFLNESTENSYNYYFYHDLENECCDLKQTEKGRNAGVKVVLAMSPLFYTGQIKSP